MRSRHESMIQPNKNIWAGAVYSNAACKDEIFQMLLVGPSKHDLVRLVGGRQRNTSRFSNVPKPIKLMFVLSPDQRLFESRALSSRKFGGRATGQPLQPQFPKTGAAGKSVLFESFKNKQFAFYLVPAQLIKGASESPPCHGLCYLKSRKWA
jgi:hypothetical protein